MSRPTELIERLRAAFYDRNNLCGRCSQPAWSHDHTGTYGHTYELPDVDGDDGATLLAYIDELEGVKAVHDDMCRLVLQRNEWSLQALADTIRIAADQGAGDALEHVADYLNNCDAIQEGDVENYERWKEHKRL